jgi:hypothetical protein
VTDQPEPGSVRIAELVATLSYAADLGLGQPMAHCMRQTVIAQRLVVTPKTAANHVEHIYAKLGVSSRAAATLYATQHGLVGTFEPAGLAAGAAGATVT